MKATTIQYGWDSKTPVEVRDFLDRQGQEHFIDEARYTVHEVGDFTQVTLTHEGHVIGSFVLPVNQVVECSEDAHLLPKSTNA